MYDAYTSNSDRSTGCGGGCWMVWGVILGKLENLRCPLTQKSPSGLKPPNSAFYLFRRFWLSAGVWPSDGMWRRCGIGVDRSRRRFLRANSRRLTARGRRFVTRIVQGVADEIPCAWRSIRRLKRSRERNLGSKTWRTCFVDPRALARSRAVPVFETWRRAISVDDDEE